MKKLLEPKVQELYKATEDSFKARNIVEAEMGITYFRRSHSNNHSDLAHTNRNDSNFYVTVLCKDKDGVIITKRHVYVGNMKK